MSGVWYSNQSNSKSNVVSLLKAYGISGSPPPTVASHGSVVNDDFSRDHEDEKLSKTNLYIRGLTAETTDEYLVNLCSRWVIDFYHQWPNDILSYLSKLCHKNSNSLCDVNHQLLCANQWCIGCQEKWLLLFVAGKITIINKIQVCKQELPLH